MNASFCMQLSCSQGHIHRHHLIRSHNPLWSEGMVIKLKGSKEMSSRNMDMPLVPQLARSRTTGRTWVSELSLQAPCVFLTHSSFICPFKDKVWVPSKRSSSAQISPKGLASWQTGVAHFAISCGLRIFSYTALLWNPLFFLPALCPSPIPIQPFSEKGFKFRKPFTTIKTRAMRQNK